MSKKGIIVGGGIAGLCAGIMLHKKGCKINIFDENPEPTVAGAGIIIAPNALQALHPYGVADEIMLMGNPCEGFHIFNEKGQLLNKMQVPSQFGKIYSLHRSDLHHILLSFLPSDSVHFGKECKHITQTNESVKVTFMDGSVEEGDFLVAADGIHSSIRKQLLNKNLYRYAGYTCWRGVVSAESIPNISNDSFETWGSKGRFGLVPLPNNQLYWYALINAKERDENLAKYTPQDLAKHFESHHKPISMIIRRTKQEQMIHRDIVDIHPMEPFYIGRTIFIGDAGHSITPNMGQGACQAIEDANILAECMTRNETVKKAFQQYDNHRQKRIQDVSKQSLQIGKMSQYGNRMMVSLRNFIFKNMPTSSMQKMAQPLYEFPHL